jgi:hypothetical protein
MRFPKVVLVAAVATLLVAPARGQGQGGGPDSAQAAQMAAQQAQIRAMMEQIARQRPPQAETAARELLRRLEIERPMLDSLLARSRDRYWQEIAQLTVQHQMLQQMQDTTRQQLMAQVFGAEARARALQRRYREILGRQPVVVVDGVPIAGAVPIQGQPPVVGAPINQSADSGRVRAIREQLQVVLERHFAAEDSLRALEIADVERRLAQVRAETARRRRDRAELVRRMVEDVLRDAKPPE